VDPGLADLPARDGRRQPYEDLTAGAHIIEAAGFSLRAASLPDIIASKKWANRPKNEQALPELRELAAAQKALGALPRNSARPTAPESAFPRRSAGQRQNQGPLSTTQSTQLTRAGMKPCPNR